MPPGTKLVTPSLLVMDRSAAGVRVSVSVALLLPGVGSVVPGGGVTVAVLVIVPIALGLIVGVNVKVTVALTGRSTLAARAPTPLAGPVTTPPPVKPVADQVAPVTPIGSGSE